MNAPTPTPIANIFLDRDGTVIEECHYLCDPKRVALFPGAGMALGRLFSLGCRLFLVTNQSGIGRGYFDAAAYRAVQTRLHKELQRFGVTLTGEAFCPHTPDHDCSCRKPGRGLWDELRAKEPLDPGASVIIGDKGSDMQFGKNCGFKASVLVLTGHGTEEAEKMGLPLPSTGWTTVDRKADSQLPDIVAVDLTAACNWIESVNNGNVGL